VPVASGELYTFGNGADGRTGHGSQENAATPRLVEELSHVRVRSVACSASHMAAVDGTPNQILVGTLWYQ
jgi:alpha-tubulin suppressor-like RCC1 family protein